MTRKQQEALDWLKANFATLPRQPTVDGVAFMTGLNTRTLSRLKKAGLIKGTVYLDGVVVDLEIV